MEKHRTSLIALITTLLGVVIGVFVSSPSQWEESISEWSRLLPVLFAATWPLLLSSASVLIGLLFGRYVFPDQRRDPRINSNIIHESEFSSRLQSIVGDQVVRQIDILSYTNETVADVIKYEYRNKEGVIFRVLSRSWFDEQQDEAAYNVRLAGSKTRHWNKADMIERIAHTPWNNVGKREQRFYWGMHPTVKAKIVYCGQHKVAFVSFYDWQEWPKEGGAPFKGANNVGVFLDSRIQNDAKLIEYLTSQFNYIWEYRSHDDQGMPPSKCISVFQPASDLTSPETVASSKIQN